LGFKCAKVITVVNILLASDVEIIEFPSKFKSTLNELLSAYQKASHESVFTIILVDTETSFKSTVLEWCSSNSVPFELVTPNLKKHKTMALTICNKKAVDLSDALVAFLREEPLPLTGNIVNIAEIAEKKIIRISV
jgi:hypothetical protein